LTESVHRTSERCLDHVLELASIVVTLVASADPWMDSPDMQPP
jgi:hypothetical protein